MLYWNIGKDICSKNLDVKYGSHFFENLSRDLRSDFPDTQGFSETNLKYMKRFYLFYSEKLHQLGDESGISHQLGDEFEKSLFVIPWRHHVEIFTRAKTVEEALFFIEKTKENGWSRSTLVNMMKTKLFETHGNTLNNFILTMPKEESECVKQILKDTYKLDFLTLRENYEEKDLHKALEDNLTKFLLELGKGFAFVERQKLVRTENDDFYIDLVFYNFALKCFVLVDLKMGQLTHKDVGQMDFYVRLFDDVYKKQDDNPTIGILLCSETDRTVAKYSVLNDSKQIFASKYLTLLPTEQELADEIERQKEIFNETHSDPEKYLK